MITRHMYHTPNMTDLGKLRSEAELKAQGDERSRAQYVIIHLHRAGEVCNAEPAQHIHYPPVTNESPV